MGKYHAQRAAIRPARGDAQAVVVPKRLAGHRHGVTAGTQVGKRVGAHAGTGHALGLPVPGLFRPRPGFVRRAHEIVGEEGKRPRLLNALAPQTLHDQLRTGPDDGGLAAVESAVESCAGEFAVDKHEDRQLAPLDLELVLAAGFEASGRAAQR